MLACSNATPEGSAIIENRGLDTLFSAAEADSLAFTLAASEGMENNFRFTQAAQEDSFLSKESFIDGFRYGFKADTATAFRYGLYCAINLANQMKQWEQQGIDFDHEKFESTFSAHFLRDSVNAAELTRYRAELDFLNRKLNEAYRIYQMSIIENSEESKSNIRAGELYIDSVAKANQQVRMMASGVAVKIDDPGTGPKVQPTDRVTLIYTASTAQGRIFEQSTDATARPVSVASRVNGLQQALGMLGKGGKATVYVPGREAYGTEGNRRFGLWPNQMVIYNITVKDIKQ